MELRNLKYVLLNIYESIKIRWSHLSYTSIQICISQRNVSLVFKSFIIGSFSLTNAFSACRIFEKVRQYFGAQSESIPMSFVLGFYVSLVVKRWWEQYKLLPWPDTLALFISAGIPGAVSRGTRAFIRYDNRNTNLY